MQINAAVAISVAAGLGGAAAAAGVPAITHQFLPRSEPLRQWRGASISGACGAAAAAALAYRYPVTRPGDALILAAWLLFLIAGLSLAWIDIGLHRLPTPLIHATATAVLGLLADAAVLTGRPAVIVTPILAAAVIGAGYVCLVAAGLSSIGMGDVRLAALTGLLLGTAGWGAVAIGVALPYLLATPFAITVHRRGGPQQLPFGPFLVAACILVGAAHAPS
jgi:leader peptidase (prepilin peptidase)/N-methyltransferase